MRTRSPVSRIAMHSTRPTPSVPMPRPPAGQDSKVCATCGRSFEWRKKWDRDWDAVKYCSKRCRGQAPGANEDAIERAIVDLLDQRKVGATICPSEVARRMHPDTWRDWMEPTRQAARRLVAAGVVVLTQKGRVVDPDRARGPIRIRLA